MVFNKLQKKKKIHVGYYIGVSPLDRSPVRKSRVKAVIKLRILMNIC